MNFGRLLLRRSDRVIDQIVDSVGSSMSSSVGVSIDMFDRTGRRLRYISSHGATTSQLY